MKVWPKSNIRSCSFHLGQTWFRNLLNLGLSKLYIEEDTDKVKFLNYIFDFPFFESDEVKDSCVFDLISNDKIEEFGDYLTKTYTQEIFPPTLWTSKSEIIIRIIYVNLYNRN
jgi:hypothetical protein